MTLCWWCLIRCQRTCFECGKAAEEEKKKAQGDKKEFEEMEKLTLYCSVDGEKCVFDKCKRTFYECPFNSD